MLQKYNIFLTFPFLSELFAIFAVENLLSNPLNDFADEVETERTLTAYSVEA